MRKPPTTITSVVAVADKVPRVPKVLQRRLQQARAALQDLSDGAIKELLQTYYCTLYRIREREVHEAIRRAIAAGAVRDWPKEWPDRARKKVVRREIVARIATKDVPPTPPELIPVEYLARITELAQAREELWLFRHRDKNDKGDDYLSVRSLKAARSILNSEAGQKRKGQAREIVAWLKRSGYDHAQYGDKGPLVQRAATHFDVDEKTIRRAWREKKGPKK